MDREKIGQFIKAIRKNNNLSQADLADKLGVTYQAVSKWENGKNLPDISILQQISKMFNVDIDEILAGETKEKKVRKNKILIPIIIIFVIILSVLLIIIFGKDNETYDFQEITTPDENFTLTGSVVKMKDRTSLLINNITYENEDNTIYKKIECSVYEEKNDTITKISSCDTKFGMTLSDYFKDSKIKIDHQAKNCSMFDESNIYIELLSTDMNDKIINIKIPLEISEC